MACGREGLGREREECGDLLCGRYVGPLDGEARSAIGRCGGQREEGQCGLCDHHLHEEYLII